MSIADEIDRLAAQRDAGRLTDAEYEAAKARVLASPSTSSGASSTTSAIPPAFASSADANPASAAASDPTSINHLRRSLTDRWIGGVCGGLAVVLGIESWIVRLAFAVAILFGGFGVIPYVLLWLFVPVGTEPVRFDR